MTSKKETQPVSQESISLARNQLRREVCYVGHRGAGRDAPALHSKETSSGRPKQPDCKGQTPEYAQSLRSEMMIPWIGLIHERWELRAPPNAAFLEPSGEIEPSVVKIRRRLEPTPHLELFGELGILRSCRKLQKSSPGFIYRPNLYFFPK